MARKTPLVGLRTDLRSLRYSKDQFGGGHSGQPYVKTQLKQDFNNEVGAILTLVGGNSRNINGIRLRPGGNSTPDFLLRENSLQSSLNDVSRLTQLLLDFNPGTGPLFIAKQNLLSLANVNFSAGYKKYEAKDRSNINIGNRGVIGTALSSAANSIVNFVNDNVAFNQGPYSPLGTIAQAGLGAGGVHLNKQGLNPFAPTTIASPLGNTPLGLPTYLNTIHTNGDEGPKSRLHPLFRNQIANPANLNLYQYNGGPGATLGVGRTIITISKGNQTIRQGDNKVFYTGFGSTTRFVLDQQTQSSIQPTIKDNGGIINFTQVVRDDPQNKSAKQAIPKSLDYAKKNADLRVNLGNPGKKGNISSYTVGKRITNETTSGPVDIENNSGYQNALDKITAFPLYQSGGNSKLSPNNKKLLNDLVQFRIGVIDNDNPSKKTHIHFRAIIDSMSDSYTSNWEAQKFMGRGENFYKYDGFDRSISLSWTVAARSKQELIPMYQKLNYLASVCAPDYSNSGYMRGNLITLTVGGYCYEQTGIMRGITLDVPTESPWEIAIDDIGTEKDSSVKELPMIIKVTGFTFTPIHDFVPKVQQNFFQEINEGLILGYGKEQYISLAADAKTNNYNGEAGNLNYRPLKPLGNPTRQSGTNNPNIPTSISPV
jgi:hypothetical protein